MRTAPLFLLFVATSLFAAGRDVTPIEYSAAPTGAIALGVASNADSFVAIWNTGYELFASAVDRSGHLTTPRGVPITNDFVANSQVLAYGSDFIITWRTKSGTQYAAEVTASLEVVRRITLPVAGRVATNGSSFAIASLEENAVTLAAADGTRIAQRYLGHTHAFSIDVVAAAHDFVVLTSSPDVEVSHVTATGQVVWHRTIFKAASPTYGGSAAAVSIDGDVAIAYSARNSALHADDRLIWTLLDSEGGSTYSTSVSLGGINNAVNGLSMIQHGSDYLLLASAQNKEQGYSGENIAHRITRGGGVSTVPVDTIRGNLPTVASNGEVLYAVRSEPVPAPRGGTYASQVFGGVLTMAPDAWLRDVLSMTPRMQAAPVLASDGTGFFGAWSDLSSEDVHWTIGALGGDGVAVSTDNIARSNPFPVPMALASNGRVNLAVWTENGIQAKRYLTNGIAIDGAPIRLAAASGYPAYVASDGNRFLIVWGDSATRSLVGAWVGEDGAVEPIGAPLATEKAPYLPYVTGLAWNGSEFLLLWNQIYIQGLICDLCTLPLPDLYAARLRSDGTPTGDAVLVESHSGNSHVASDGHDFLVVVDEKPGGRLSSVTARFVRRDGSSLVVDQPSTLFTWPVASFSSNVAFNGTEFVVATRYGFGGVSYLSATHVGANAMIRDRFLTSVGPADESGETVAIASNRSRDVLLAISEARDGWGVPRIRSYKESELVRAPLRPSPPTPVSATVTTSTVTARWMPVSGDLQGYVVERVTSGAPFIVATAPATATSATFTADVGAKVQVRAFSAGGTSDASAVIVAIPPARRRAVN
jgi:hypothetical protein